MEGRIKTITDRGFGFITQRGGPDIFFHANDCDMALEFNEQLTGLDVVFEVMDSPRGPRAVNVRPIR